MNMDSACDDFAIADMDLGTGPVTTKAPANDTSKTEDVTIQPIKASYDFQTL